MSTMIHEWRDMKAEFQLITKFDVKEIDTHLKTFWASGMVGSKQLDKHVMHLAHGYSHAIYVANLAAKIAQETGTENPKTAFITGLLHDSYRPILSGDGMEKHAEYCAEVAEDIMRHSSNKFKKGVIPAIKRAIAIHDLGEDDMGKPTGERTLGGLLEQPLNMILFLADKSHMNLERVMSYAYDCYTYARDPTTPPKEALKLDWYKSRGELGAMNIVISKVAKKLWRDTKITTEIQAKNGRFGSYCKNVFLAWENTVDELQSQLRKEQRGEDSARTIMLFWAFKEAISNLRYLAMSEEEVHQRKGDEEWDFLDKVIGRYRRLILNELEGEPFVYILDFRRRKGAK